MANRRVLIFVVLLVGVVLGYTAARINLVGKTNLVESSLPSSGTPAVQESVVSEVRSVPEKAAPKSKSGRKPNVVLVLMDNLGYGELGVYGGGILRGAPTPRIDKLAAEGSRLLNFNVEAQCTPSRAALMTGRYAIRTGNATVPFGTPVYGLVQWEVTLAKMMSAAGYATGAFGKWHLGHTKGRFPTDQGFDEWYGIPNSSDESYWSSSSLYRPTVDPFARATQVMQGTKGAEPKSLKTYDLKERRLIDREITDKAIDFMGRQVKAGKPFFAFIPYTMPHLPILPHPDFDGKTGNGVWADTLAQIDAYTGELLDTVEKLGVSDDTIFIFTSDNGPEMLEPWTGWNGPWRGTYFTGLEGSLRVPFIIRWPGHIPAGQVSNEIVHEMDLFPTLARVAGGKVPGDRPIDGVDQLDFLLGSQPKSNREGLIVYVGSELFGVKYQNWKFMTKELERGTDSVKEYGVPRLFNLNMDPKEEHALSYEIEYGWVRFPITKILNDHMASLNKYPSVRPGAPDPYVPGKGK